MMEKPKNLCILFIIVTCCMSSFCTANDANSDQESGRALSLAAANHPAGNSSNLLDIKYKCDFYMR